MSKSSIVSALAVFVGLAVTPASADNDGFHPSSLCRAMTPGIYFNTSAYVENRATATPSSTGTGYVTCPILTRDASEGGTMRFVALDRSTSGGVECAVATRLQTGATSYVQMLSTGGSSGTWEVVSKSGITVGFSSAHAPRTNWMECSIPAAATAGSGRSALGAYYFLDN